MRFQFVVEQRSTKAKNLLSGSGCVGCGKVAGVFVASLVCPLSTWARLSLQSCGENVLRITVVDPYIFSTALGSSALFCIVLLFSSMRMKITAQ